MMKTSTKENIGVAAISLWIVGWAVAIFLISTFACGCMGNKASHQNGIVLYVSTSGQLGLGYGETEDLPGGCAYRREVTQSSPAFWGGGTNYTHTVTEWDTRAMAATNAVCTCSLTNCADRAASK